MVILFGYKEIMISIIIYLVIVVVLKLKYRKENLFFIFFTIMYIYIIFVIKLTQFPIYITEFQHQIIGPVKWGRDINLIPFKDAFNITSILNILMTIPFGFGLSFLIKRNFKKTVIAGAIFSFLIELTQLLVALIVGYTFRKIDINDVIFNTLGVVMGYLIFMIFIRIVNFIFKHFDDKFIKYICGR